MDHEFTRESQSDKRTQPRFLCSKDRNRSFIMDPDESIPVAATIIDVCKSGVCLLTLKQYEAGQSLKILMPHKIIFYHPDTNGDDMTSESEMESQDADTLTCTVQWCREIGDKAYRIGISTEEPL